MAWMTSGAVPSPCPESLLLPQGGNPLAGKEVEVFLPACLEPVLCVWMHCSQPHLRCSEETDAGAGRFLLSGRCC